MDGWTSADYVAVIAALAAAITGIIAALKGQQVERKVETVQRQVGSVSDQVAAHEENATTRARLRGEQEHPSHSPPPFDPKRIPPRL